MFFNKVLDVFQQSTLYSQASEDAQRLVGAAVQLGLAAEEEVFSKEAFISDGTSSISSFLFLNCF